MNYPKELGKHGWQSAFDPQDGEHYRPIFETFSLSFWKLVKTRNGKGTKKQPVYYRLKGLCSNRDAVIKRAEEIIRDLDDGWMPTKRMEKYMMRKEKIQSFKSCKS